MMEIWIPILAVTVIGLICAVGLAVASSVMAVKEDTRFTELRECLPGANCGACGYTGCDGYAKALMEPGRRRRGEEDRGAARREGGGGRRKNRGRPVRGHL